MSSTETTGSANGATAVSAGTVRRIGFVAQAAAGQEILLEFRDPVPHQAVVIASETAAATDHEGLEVLTIAGPSGNQLGASDELLQWVAAAGPAGAALPSAVAFHGTQAIWNGARAAIVAPPERTPLVLTTLVDFCYHELQLRKLEREIADSWPQLEADTPLAYGVSVPDPDRFDTVAEQMEQTLKRRIRLARLGPHLQQSRPHLPLLANQLSERLREKAQIEERLDAVTSQLDLAVHVYEMSSQRITDFNAARQERTLEWIIIVLLAAETLLLLIDILWHLGI